MKLYQNLKSGLKKAAITTGLLAVLGGCAGNQVRDTNSGFQKGTQLEETVSFVDLDQYRNKKLSKAEIKYLANLEDAYRTAANDYENMIAIILPTLEVKGSFNIDARGNTKLAIQVNEKDLIEQISKFDGTERSGKKIIKELLKYNPEIGLESNNSYRVGDWQELYIAAEPHTFGEELINMLGTKTPGSIDQNLKAVEYEKAADEIKEVLKDYAVDLMLREERRENESRRRNLKIK